MATHVQPATRYATSDWFTSSYTTSTNADRQHTASHDIRQDIRSLQNKTEHKNKWDQLDTNTRLADRVDPIITWNDALEKTLADIYQKIADISTSNENLEQPLEATNLPTEVNTGNSVTREGRQGIDVVEDEVEDQLHKEQEVIGGITKQLQNKIDESFEQMSPDLQDKNFALAIDVDQYIITEESSGISFKPDTCILPKGSTTPEQWEDFSHYNKERVDAEIANSRRMREAAHHALQQTDNDLESQGTATDYEYLKRMYKFERAIDELDWQKKQTEEEIAEAEENVRHLMDAILIKINPMKVAQTQYGIIDKVEQLEASKVSLGEKLEQAQHSLDGLEQNLHRINEDLQCKTNSLKLDQSCMQSREKLKSNRPQTSTERNMKLTGISRQKSSILA